MSDLHRPIFDARVRAVLGPTNTGKTHLAITRLLAHASGIIGFPLRLLARENYDRMVAAKGERHVALITGEEKIVPPEAKWFACTVEAMPLDRQTEFVAVDEIQLCADPDRGHVFTDRLLHARGMVETMFLGAETIRPLLQRLVPRAEIETRPRLSQLTHSGPVKLTRLPARSAVVAFSAGEVYAIAEAIRRRRGGCAVVMGRLSPRTRNAQVALYQEREVDFLVATDAIGMGLNMDVDHVAFAALTKFDGHAIRSLTPQEAAQIAGRAGRGMRDGTFGPTGDCPPLPDEIVNKVEKHDFEPLGTLAWRNSDLDFSSVDGLLDSLAAPPPTAGLAKGHDATDHITLSMLAREEDIRKLADGSRSRLRLLWEACQVPDFRKLSDDSHTALCGRVFRHLAEDGVLPDEWVAGQIATLGNIEGDLDTLMARLASIRVWSYVAARADWVRDALRFQNEARAAEDAVSDALHERLTARFVDRRAAHLIRRLDDTEEELLSAVTRQGEVVVEGHPVGRVAGFLFQPEPGEKTEEERRLVLRAARRALREEMPRRVAALDVAADNAFALTPDHRVTWTSPGGEPAEVARLRPGPEPSKPAVDVIASEFLDGPQRERVRARLAKWVEGLVARELGAIAAVEAKAEADSSLRGPAYLLREQLGIAPGATEREILGDVRQKLKGIGVRAGRFALFLPEALKPRAMALRAQIWSLIRDIPVPTLPPPGLIALPMRPIPDGEVPPPHMLWPSGFAEAMGWLPAGPVLLRLDVAERIAAELGFLTRRAPAPPPHDLASRLGVKGDTLGIALTALGFRILDPLPLAEGQFGPPTPLRVAQPRPFQPPRRDARGAGAPAQQQRQGPRPERDRRPPSEAPAPSPRQDSSKFYGPPVPPELRAARPDRHRRPSQAPMPRNGGAEFYGPPLPPEMRAALRPPRPERDQQPGRQQQRLPREGQRPFSAKPPNQQRAASGKPWQGGGQRGPAGPRGGDSRPDRPPHRSGPPPKPPEKRMDPDSPFAILANLKLR